MRPRLIAACLAAGALVLGTPVTSRAINTVAPTAGAASREVPAAQNPLAAKFSPGVADVVKMVDAKVDPEVIKTYIKNAPTAYNPSATEIIALKDRGVGSEILTAMLQHGAEVRAQAMRAAPSPTGPAAPQVTPGAANPYAPVYDYSAQPVYPSYAYTYPATSYVYPAYSYASPVYYYGGYNCGYYWPWYWPSFSFGCYPYSGYCGYPNWSCGYRYPCYYGGRGYGYYYGGRGYYGGSAYYGNRGYHGTGAYYGGRGYYGTGARPVPYAGRSASFHSFGSAGRPATFVSASGGSRSASGFSGHAVSSGGRGGGFGGHSMGRSR